MSDQTEQLLDFNESDNTARYEDAIRWWEEKRWIFNMSVGIVGLAVILLATPNFNLRDLVGIIWWAILANILYSSGELMEIWNTFYLQDKLPIKSWRLALLVLGTLAYCFTTFAYAWMYFLSSSYVD